MFVKFHWICSESFWDIEKLMGSDISETVGINVNNIVFCIHFKWKELSKPKNAVNHRYKSSVISDI